MVEAVRYCKENNSDLIIISGANEFFIEVILGVVPRPLLPILLCDNAHL
jgi:2-hydroxy-3-keto-5-methylthiopentenyl-1-phosphate phosphatase